jgi:hypothetical protein
MSLITKNKKTKERNLDKKIKKSSIMIYFLKKIAQFFIYLFFCGNLKQTNNIQSFEF